MKKKQAFEKLALNHFYGEIRLKYFHYQLDEYFLGNYGRFLW